MREQAIILIEGGNVRATCLRTSYREDLGTHRGAVIIKGGTIDLSGIVINDGLIGNYATFCLPYSTNSFTMTGGTINILNPTTNNPGYSANNFGIIISAIPQNITISGGVINIRVSEGNDEFINSNAPFYDLNIIGTAAAVRNIRVINYTGYWDPTPAPAGYPHLAALAAQPLIVLHNLTLNNNKGINNTGNVDLYVKGDYVINSGSTYTPNTNTTIFNGSADQLFNIQGNIGGSLNNFKVTNTSVLTLNNTLLGNPININGNLQIDHNCVLIDNGRTIQVQGNITNSGTHFKPPSGPGNITLTGGAPQAITGDGTGSFNNLLLTKQVVR